MKKNKQPAISAADWEALDNYKKHVDRSTRFIPGWVKFAVTMALGLGTMVGWKRIVVTVGEKIGKEHLTSGQGAAAGITAMFTIGAADWFGLPVSTNARAVVRDRGNHGGEPFRPAMGDCAELGHGVGAYFACVDGAGGLPLLGVPEPVLGLATSRGFCSSSSTAGKTTADTTSRKVGPMGEVQTYAPRHL